MAIEVSIFKFLFSFITIKCIAFILAWLIITFLFIGIVTFPYWWHDCLYEQQCFEKDFLQNGLSQIVILTPEYLKYYLLTFVSYSILLILILGISSLIGIKVRIDKTILLTRISHLRKMIPWVKSKFFIPITTATYFIVFLCASSYVLHDMHLWKLKINRDVDDNTDSLFDLKARALERNSQDHFHIDTRLTFSKYSNNIIYFNPEIRNSIYNDKKYYRVQLSSFDLKKEMDVFEKLNYFIDQATNLKQIHIFTSYSYDREALFSTYEIDTAIRILKKLAPDNSAKSLLIKLTTLKQKNKEKNILSYNGQRYIVVGGRIVGNKVQSEHSNLLIDITSSSYDLKNANAGLLLEVKSHTRKNNDLMLTCDIIAQWEN